MNNLAKVIALGGRRLNRALAMHYLFGEQGIPKGYIPLEYIESTGTQYIDLGIKPSDDMEFEIEYQSLATRAAKLFGCQVASNSLFDAYNVGKTGVTIRVFAHSNSGGVLTDITTIAGQKTSLKLVIKNGTYSVYVNGELVATSPAAGTVPNLNIFLFASNRNGSPDGYGSQIVYGCRIKKSGELVGDFRPYLNDNGEAGMYNTVDRKFHKNLGTGDFIAGYGFDNYIHDAANLFLDGIWNSAEGVHSDTLTSWVDLSGNCQPTPLMTGNSIEENCITSDGTDNGRMTVPDLDPINLGTFTLEVLFKRNGNTNANQVIMGRNNTKSYYLNTARNNLTVWLGDNENTFGVINGTDKFLVQLTYTGSSFSVWLDGEKVISDKSNTILTDTSKLNLFGYSGNNTTFMGSIFALRLHNRVLTDVELAQNYEIDKARFGLTETASVMSLRMAEEVTSSTVYEEEQTIIDELEVTEDDIV